MTTETEPSEEEEETKSEQEEQRKKLEEAYRILKGVTSETTDRLEPEIREDERRAREEEQERRDDAEGRGEEYYHPGDSNGNGGKGGNGKGGNGTDRTEDRNHHHQEEQQQQEQLGLVDTVDHLIDKFKCKTLRDDNVRNLEILYYNPIDGCYHPGGEVKIREELEEISDHKITEHARREIVHHVKYSTLIDKDRFDRNPDLKHFRNGYYNIATNHFTKGHTPDYLSMTSIPHDFDPKDKMRQNKQMLN